MSRDDGLRQQIERWASEPESAKGGGGGGGGGSDEARAAVARLIDALNDGSLRAAEFGPDGWEAVEWVKAGILLAFRLGRTVRFETGAQEFFDRDTLPLRPTDGVSENVRIVPGGSSVRGGVYLAPGVVIMPPAYINVGAYVGEETMIDSHALIGSCAQIGARVHISAGAQIGGVLEPVGLRPVIIEDEVVIGGNAGVFEGTLVGRRAVIAPGVNLTASTPVFDLVRGEVYRGGARARAGARAGAGAAGRPLSIPEGAVVVPGSRPAAGEFAESQQLQLYSPVIVKYRDEKTDAATALESALR